MASKNDSGSTEVANETSVDDGHRPTPAVPASTYAGADKSFALADNPAHPGPPVAALEISRPDRSGHAMTVPPEAAGSAPPRTDVENMSIGDLFGNVSQDLSTLMRQELALAKAEPRTEAAKAGTGVGMLGAAGFAGYIVLLFASIALWWALANAMDEGLSALIVAVVWAIAGVVLHSTGRGKLREMNPKPERTVDTLKQVPHAITGQ